jgi:hypothetical protein
MPTSKPSGNRPASSTPGVKMLITATSLVATIGGWAVLSNQEGASSSTSSTPTSNSAQPATALTVQLPPLPTLIPPPDPKTLAINTQPAIVPSSKRQAVAPAQAAAAPAPQIAGLRVVAAPSIPSGGGGGSVAAAPRPATNTRSSK